MQNRKEFTATFRKIWRGKSSKKEKQAYALWFSQLDLSAGQMFRDGDHEQRIGSQIAYQIDEHFAKTVQRKTGIHFSSWVALAAAVLLVLGSVLLFLPDMEKGSATPYQLVATQTGQRKIITLTDGTIVTLNNSSRLKFPTHFGGAIRKVFLEGEAFFQVAHLKNKPFIVQAGQLGVQVLGTSFNIHNYPLEQTIAVTVSTGKVGVSPAHKKASWMLRPGQQLSYHKKTGLASQSSVNPDDYSGWQKGELIFKNETLKTIAKRLERWYGVKIEIETSALQTKRVSLTQKDESLQSVLKMLGIVAEFKYEIKGKAVRIW